MADYPELGMHTYGKPNRTQTPGQRAQRKKLARTLSPGQLRQLDAAARGIMVSHGKGVTHMSSHPELRVRWQPESLFPTDADLHYRPTPELSYPAPPPDESNAA